jgi:protein-S-isoprenylcysteine O-methyltransferase Ste14
MRNQFRSGPSFLLQSSATLLVVALIILLPGKWHAARWIGLAISVPSALLLVIARYQLGGSFSVAPKARALVTHGLYSRIRNPMYVFSGLTILGLVIALQSPFGYVVPVVLLVVQMVRAHREARVLEEQFGEEYRRYRAQTWF